MPFSPLDLISLGFDIFILVVCLANLWLNIRILRENRRWEAARKVRVRWD